MIIKEFLTQPIEDDYMRHGFHPSTLLPIVTSCHWEVRSITNPTDIIITIVITNVSDLITMYRLIAKHLYSRGLQNKNKLQSVDTYVHGTCVQLPATPLYLVADWLILLREFLNWNVFIMKAPLRTCGWLGQYGSLPIGRICPVVILNGTQIKSHVGYYGTTSMYVSGDRSKQFYPWKRGKWFKKKWHTDASWNAPRSERSEGHCHGNSYSVQKMLRHVHPCFFLTNCDMFTLRYFIDYHLQMIRYHYSLLQLSLC